MIVGFIICIALTLSESIALMQFAGLFNKERALFCKYRILYYFLYLVSGVTWAYLLQDNICLRILVVTTTYVLFTYASMKTKPLYALTIGTFVMNCIVIIEFLILLISINTGLFRWVTAENYLEITQAIMTVFEIVLLAVFSIIAGKKKGSLINTKTILSTKEWFAIFIISLVSEALVIVTVSKSELLDMQRKDFSITLIGIAVSFLYMAIITLFTKSAKRQRHILESDAILERVKNETALYRSISESLEKQRRRSHEFDNKIAAIKGMLEQGKIQELCDYVNVIDSEKTNAQKEFNTNNVIVNAILSTKYEEMQSKGIAFVMMLGDLSELKMSDEDIVILLSNLLNNAIEASENTEEKIVKFKFAIEDGKIILSVKNTYDRKPNEASGELLTTKLDKMEEHGIGLKNVKEVVEKNKGIDVIDFDEKWFSVSIIIPG